MKIRSTGGDSNIDLIDQSQLRELVLQEAAKKQSISPAKAKSGER